MISEKIKQQTKKASSAKLAPITFMGLMKALKSVAKLRNNRFHASVEAIIS